MPEDSKTFSESWYRVANQRIYLRPGTRIHRHHYRGERWVVLENPFSNQFFRLRPIAYEFVGRLRPDRTVAEVWQECLERNPDEAPGQEAVLQLLGQLYQANLLQYRLGGDAAQLFDRYKKRRQREIRSRLTNLMFMRFPLLDPDVFLNRTIGLVGKVITPVGGLIWLFVVGWAIKLAIDHFPELRDQSQGVLAPSNLPLLYLGLVIIKTLHEFGHAYFCKKFGGEVHVMGILLMIFTPIPYMDATSSWGFRSRWRRISVGAAGMIVEVFVAAIATLVWVRTGEGTIHSLAYNMMFVASVSTLLFNLNPLLRFDGYYILSDLLGFPNLHQSSRRQLRHLWEHYVYGVKRSESPSSNRREVGWFTSFGILSWIYRVFVFGSILLFVADRFLLLGLIMLGICAVSWVIVPAGKFINYLASSPRLERCRPRAVFATMAVVGVLVLSIQVIPLPSHFRAVGVLQAKERAEVVNESSGAVEAILAEPGSSVRSGQPLLRLVNKELEFETSLLQGRERELASRIRSAMQHELADLQPLESSIASLKKRQERLRLDLERLTVHARHSGIWIAPQAQEMLGRWLPKGTVLGLIVNPEQFEFAATVQQTDANSLFEDRKPTAEIRFSGEADRVVPVLDHTIIPADRNRLASPALGWAGGGEVAIVQGDTQGLQTAEPFFEVRAQLPTSTEATLMHGRTGKIRFDLGTEPLAHQLWRRFRQLLQKRYQF